MFGGNRAVAEQPGGQACGKQEDGGFGDEHAAVGQRRGVDQAVRDVGRPGAKQAAGAERQGLGCAPKADAGAVPRPAAFGSQAEVVRRVSRLEHAVISLGGGTFIHEANRRTLLERGPVVVLWATPETVYQRTKHSDRPLLRAEDPLGRIRSLMDEREGVYRQGTIHVHSDGRPSEEIVEEIIERLWNWSDAAHAWAEAPEAVADRATD